MIKPIPSKLGKHIYDITDISPALLLAHLYENSEVAPEGVNAAIERGVSGLKCDEANAILKQNNGVIGTLFGRPLNVKFAHCKNIKDSDLPKGRLYAKLDGYVALYPSSSPLCIGSLKLNTALGAAFNSTPPQPCKRIDPQVLRQQVTQSMVNLVLPPQGGAPIIASPRKDSDTKSMLWPEATPIVPHHNP